MAVETQPPKRLLCTSRRTIHPRRDVHDGAAVENTTAAPKNLLPSALQTRNHLRGGVQAKDEHHHSSMGGGGDTALYPAAVPSATKHALALQLEMRHISCSYSSRWYCCSCRGGKVSHNNKSGKEEAVVAAETVAVLRRTFVLLFCGFLCQCKQNRGTVVEFINSTV